MRVNLGFGALVRVSTFGAFRLTAARTKMPRAVAEFGAQCGAQLANAVQLLRISAGISPADIVRVSLAHRSPGTRHHPVPSADLDRVLFMVESVASRCLAVGLHCIQFCGRTGADINKDAGAALGPSGFWRNRRPGVARIFQIFWVFIGSDCTVGLRPRIAAAARYFLLYLHSTRVSGRHLSQ